MTSLFRRIAERAAGASTGEARVLPIRQPSFLRRHTGMPGEGIGLTAGTEDHELGDRPVHAYGAVPAERPMHEDAGPPGGGTAAPSQLTPDESENGRDAGPSPVVRGVDGRAENEEPRPAREAERPAPRSRRGDSHPTRPGPPTDTGSAGPRPGKGPQAQHSDSAAAVAAPASAVVPVSATNRRPAVQRRISGASVAAPAPVAPGSPSADRSPLRGGLAEPAATPETRARSESPDLEPPSRPPVVSHAPSWRRRVPTPVTGAPIPGRKPTRTPRPTASVAPPFLVTGAMTVSSAPPPDLVRDDGERSPEPAGTAPARTRSSTEGTQGGTTPGVARVPTRVAAASGPGADPAADPRVRPPGVHPRPGTVTETAVAPWPRPTQRTTTPAAGRPQSGESMADETTGPAERAVEVRIGSIEVTTTAERPTAPEPTPAPGPQLTGFADQLARRSYVSTDRGRY